MSLPLNTRVATLALAIALLTAAPAAASTVPTLDRTRGQQTVALGAVDLSYDYQISDHQSLGFAGSIFGSAGLRSIFRLGGDVNGPNWGWTMGAGTSWGPLRFIYNTSASSNDPEFWVSPALVGSYPIPIFDTGAALVFRGTLGPGLTFIPFGSSKEAYVDTYLNVFANFEVALRLGRHIELTALGQSLAGLRATF